MNTFKSSEMLRTAVLLLQDAHSRNEHSVCFDTRLSRTQYTSAHFKLGLLGCQHKGVAHGWCLILRAAKFARHAAVPEALLYQQSLRPVQE